MEIGDKEGVVIRAVLDLTQRGDHLRLIAVADVILFAVGHPSAVRLRHESRFGGIDVRAMRPFGKAESEDRPFFQQIGGLLFGLFIGAHPDGPQPQNGDLKAVPVAQTVKGEQLAVFTVAGRVPAAVRIPAAVCAGREQFGENLFPADEIDKLPVPDFLVEIFRDARFAHLFEEGDGFVHNGPRARVGHQGLILFRLQQIIHETLLSGRNSFSR